MLLNFFDELIFGVILFFEGNLAIVLGVIVYFYYIDNRYFKIQIL